MSQDNIKERIRKLYSKYLLKNISKEEYEELFDLFQKDSNKHYIESIIDESIQDKLPATQDQIPLSLSPFKDRVVPEANPRNSQRFIYISSAAAAILLLMVAVFFLFKGSREVWVVYSTDFQETKKVELPDGSMVVLNANSELKWQKGFEKKEIRRVDFTGEGYFDVAHLDGKGFVVKTGSIEVNVLGTVFNLETRRQYTNIFLKEGKVVLKGQDLHPIEMAPGDLVHYDTEQKQINKVSNQASASAISWKEGVFTFTDLTGIQILEKMEDIYGKEFLIEQPTLLKDVIVVQGLPYTDWDFTQEALELALGVEFTDSTSNKIIVRIK